MVAAVWTVRKISAATALVASGASWLLSLWPKLSKKDCERQLWRQRRQRRQQLLQHKKQLSRQQHHLQPSQRFSVLGHAIGWALAAVTWSVVYTLWGAVVWLLWCIGAATAFVATWVTVLAAVCLTINWTNWPLWPSLIGIVAGIACSMLINPKQLSAPGQTERMPQLWQHTKQMRRKCRQQRRGETLLMPS
jgi:hypothetical protein